jgi:glycolate oxidase FAD binding subunit
MEVPQMVAPSTPQDLAAALADAAGRKASISLEGCGSKRRMAGPVEAAEVCITTSALTRVIEYEPRDLTISVEAGMPWRDFTSLLARERQMAPLDPPFAEQATVGGVVASNSSGPRRRLHGTARDLVIGMQFATLEGKLVKTGGMVVKNVAGLDIAKLMIGSFGTLAAITSVNFKLLPMPNGERSFLLAFDSLAGAIAARNRILTGVLQPAAIDLLNPASGTGLGNPAWLLAVRAGGSPAVLARYERELAAIGEGVALENSRHDALWAYIQDFTPRFLASHSGCTIVRASCTLKVLEEVIGSFPGAAVARAGSGVCYGYFEDPETAGKWIQHAAARGWKAVVEFAPEAAQQTMELWPSPGNDLEVMKRIKNLFDPGSLLNRGRLYRRV